MKADDIILTSILDCAQHELYAEPKSLTEDQGRQFETMKQRFEKGEPLQYILGEWEFCGQTLAVDERVLIPRPETEILVEEILKRGSDFPEHLDVLNVGVGSANIEIAIARAIERASITGVEISADALAVAQKNVDAHELAQKITLVHEDGCHYLISIDKKYDMIVSNPPYISTADMACLPEDVKREPALALDGGADGLDYFRAIIANGTKLLNANGYMLFECGDAQHEAIAEMFRDMDMFSKVEFVKDLSGVVRVIVAQRSS